MSSVAFAGSGVYRRRIVTSDGVPLALYRYLPQGGGRSSPPVLLIADLGMGREVFDLDGFGLAPYLQVHGRETFVLEPRGHGSSGVPHGWRLEDVVTRDLPAAVAAIHALRPGPVDLVAHGYLGTLAMAATVRELRGQVGRVVAIATPASAEVPNALARKFLEKGGRFTSLPLDPAGEAVLETLLAKHGKFGPGRLQALRGRAFSDLGATASGELLAWMRSGDFAFPDGSTVRSRLRDYDRATFELIPLRDNWVHPEHAGPLRELAPNARVSVRLLSLLQYLAEDYTHLSVLQGEGSARDIFPLVTAFLGSGRESRVAGAP